MRSGGALRAWHHCLYLFANPSCLDHPPIDLPRHRLVRTAPLRPFVCREDAAASRARGAGAPATDATSTSASSAYPVERSLRRADALALSLRAGLDRIAIPLARAAAAFVQRQAWSDFGFARLEDHARERFGRSGRWVKDCASLGAAIHSLPRLAEVLTGDDGGRPIGRVAGGPWFGGARGGGASPAGPPPDADSRPMKVSPDPAVVEIALANSTDNWSPLPATSPASWSLALAGVSLARLRDVAGVAGT